MSPNQSLEVRRTNRRYRGVVRSQKRSSRVTRRSQGPTRPRDRTASHTPGRARRVQDRHSPATVLGGTRPNDRRNQTTPASSRVHLMCKQSLIEEQLIHRRNADLTDRAVNPTASGSSNLPVVTTSTQARSVENVRFRTDALARHCACETIAPREA